MERGRKKSRIPHPDFFSRPFPAMHPWCTRIVPGGNSIPPSLKCNCPIPFPLTECSLSLENREIITRSVRGCRSHRNKGQKGNGMSIVTRPYHRFIFVHKATGMLQYLETATPAFMHKLRGMLHNKRTCRFDVVEKMQILSTIAGDHQPCSRYSLGNCRIPGAVVKAPA